jgi:arsenate reductase
MAEGFFRRYFDPTDEVFSAGLEPSIVDPRAIAVMAETGIDISSHTSKHLGQFLGQRFDYVITVCDSANAKCPVFPGVTRRLHWPFDDPARAQGTEKEVLDVFRRVRDQIDAAVIDWLAQRQQDRSL